MERRALDDLDRGDGPLGPEGDLDLAAVVRPPRRPPLEGEPPVRLHGDDPRVPGSVGPERVAQPDAVARPRLVGEPEPRGADDVANLVIGQMLHLAAKGPRDDIRLYVNSPGGSVTAGLAIYDTMQKIAPDVQTVCLGQAASFAALLVAAGAPGKRMVLPNARILLHQPHVQGIGGQTTDVEIQAREMGRARRRIEELFAHHTGQTVEQIHTDLERDFILDAEEAVTYGCVDEVL